MDILIPLLIVVIILGALLGGKSFGDTVNKGCGFLIWLAIAIVSIGLILYSLNLFERATNNQEEISPSDNSAYFVAKQDCQTYTKPNIESDTSGHLKIGKELFIENVNKFKYFYEVTDENAKMIYVRKDCLIKK